MSAELNSQTERTVRTGQRPRALTSLLTSGVALIAFLTLTHYGIGPTTSVVVAFLLLTILEYALDYWWRPESLSHSRAFAAIVYIPPIALGAAAAIAALDILGEAPLTEFFLGMSAALIANFVWFWTIAQVLGWLSSRRELPA